MEEPVYIKNMRELRKKAHYTQEEVSQKLNIQRQTYSNYENEWRQPPLDIIIRLAELYQVSTDYLLLGSEPDNDSRITPVEAPLCPDGDARVSPAQASLCITPDIEHVGIKTNIAKENAAHFADTVAVTEHVFRSDITDINSMQEQESGTVPITCNAPDSNQADCLHPSAAVHKLLKEFYSLSEEEQTEAWLFIQTQESISPDWIFP